MGANPLDAIEQLSFLLFLTLRQADHLFQSLLHRIFS
jgi:hypothetical protein